jgi:manganese/zinc/iron transport system substrate-binding protein
MHMLATRVLALLLALTVVVGCGDATPGAPTQLRVVATTPMLGDLVRHVAGEHATVTTLIGEGVDPHLYKPTRTDVEAIVAADVVVTNGLFLEGRMQDAFDRAAESGKTVVRAGDALPSDSLLHPEGAEAHPDPHIWMDPLRWALCAPVVADALAKRDPTNAGAYRRNAEAFAAEASALHDAAVSTLQAIPPDARVLVTAHDAFGYFGQRFNLEVHGIQGISTESEAGLADLERLVDLLVARKIRAVFVESTVSPRTVEALIAGAKAKGHTVRIGGELYSDSMGKPGTPEGTWRGMLEHNVRVVAEALGGAAGAKP